MFDDATQQTAPDHQILEGQVSFSGNDDCLAMLIGSSGISCTWILRSDQAELSWIIGRGVRAHFKLPSNSRRLSSSHFRIWATRDDPPTIMMQDLSTNGTLLNSVRMPKDRNCMLVNGDVITVGMGVTSDEIKFIVSIPKTSKAAPQGGIYDSYDFGEMIGQGGFALVRQAVKRETGDRVAVKIIDKSKITGTEHNAVEREIDILKRLKHDNIVGLHDIFVDSKYYYLVMDFVPHGDLMEYLLNNQNPEQPGLPEDMSREIVREVLEAVSYVHDMGISHRDLKPDNILINSINPVSVKVADFGLAKLQNQGTFLKTFCGTLAYLAPEVLKSRYTDSHIRQSIVYTRLVDIWSVGCLAYVILTGCMPFGGATQEELYNLVITGEFHEQPLVAAKVSPSARDFIKSLLNINTEMRPQANVALMHPWFTGGDETLSSYEEIHPKMNGDSVSSDEVSQHNGGAIAETLPSHYEQASLTSSMPGALEQFGSMQDSEEDDDDMRKQVDFECSQHRHPSLSMAPRDLDDFEFYSNDANLALPEGAWGELETQPTSLPCKDMFFTRDSFSIGRSDPKLAGDVPVVDNAIKDPRLSRIHCRFYRERVSTDSTGGPKWEVFLEAYNLMYLGINQIDPNTRVRVYNGDLIRLFAEPKKSGDGFESLLFQLKLFDNDEKFLIKKRPKHEMNHLRKEKLKREDFFGSSFAHESMILPPPETPIKNKRERSNEIVPAPKRMHTFLSERRKY